MFPPAGGRRSAPARLRPLRFGALSFALAAALGACRDASDKAPQPAAKSARPPPSTAIVPGAAPSAREPPPSATASAGAAAASASDAAADSASAPPAEAETREFEDELSDGGLDAGAGNARAITSRVWYAPYANGRFAFLVDVPTALRAMPEPADGDGQQWRLGHLVAMTASGAYAQPGDPRCPSSPHVTAHTESKTACFATGKLHGYIYWERHVVAHGIDYSLRFQYAQGLKSAMDRVIARVNRSWLF